MEGEPESVVLTNEESAGLVENESEVPAAGSDRDPRVQYDLLGE
jgi:hypothetical protein